MWFLILNNITKIKYIGDYTYKNLNKFKTLLPNIETNILCPLFHKNFIINNPIKKINENNILNDNIDILFFGSLNNRRIKIKNDLNEYFKNKNLNIIFCYDYENTLYYFKKSKIVLVINFYEEDFPIDYYRITQLICNKVFIIHEDVQKEDKKSNEYKLLSKSLVFTEYDDICKTCEKYLNISENKKNEITEKTFECFKNNFDTIEKFKKIF